MTNDDGHALDWDSEIKNDAPEFITLKPGEYDAVVTAVERGRYTPRPGAKLPACPEATVSIKIETEDGEAIIKHRLFLHSRCEGMLCEFFTSIGQRKHGEALRPNWGKVPGSRCRVKVGNRTGSDGQTYNEIKRLLDPDAKQESAQGGTGWKAGEF